MHYPNVLEHFDCGPVRLREIFTMQPAPADAPDMLLPLTPSEMPQAPRTKEQICGYFRNRARSRIMDGITTNLRMSRQFQAVDMAMDAPPIQPFTIPLMMWAQGKIKIEQTYDCIKRDGGEAQADRFFTKVKKENREVLKLDASRITDVQIDLVKSTVTRRLAAIDALWSNIWPLLRYDPRGTDDVAMARADVLTQRVDIISDAYNYRHFGTQCRRQMLAYGFSVAFAASPWDRQTGLRPKITNTSQPGDKLEVESYVTREGVEFINPHPARIGYDLSKPLANLNTDTGPSFIFFWDIIPWRDLINPSNKYYNLESVFTTGAWDTLFQSYGNFFNYYFDPCVLKWPTDRMSAPGASNARDQSIGRYTAQMTDVGILVSHYYERVNPLLCGIGKYNADVWLHLTIAGDSTVIAAEFLPSIPGAYGGINMDDNRLGNQSMAMALLGYQDMMSNTVSSMWMQLRTSLIQLWLLDKDSLDKEVIEDFRNNAADNDWWVDRKVLIYSASKLRDMGIQDPRSAFAVVQANVQNVFDSSLKAINQILNLVDRMLILSPNELGQPNPREVAAREVTEMASSVQAINAFNNEGPREQVAAQKEMIYDALITHGTQNFRVPVEKRYTRDVLSRAGFSIPEDVKVPVGEEFVPVKTPVMGNLRNLTYDYYFNSRDGAERVVNTQGAQVIMQLLQSILQIPPLAQKMGIKNIMDMANTVIRMSGAPTNFQFELPVGGDDPNLGGEDPQKLAQAVQAVQQKLAQMEQFLTQALRMPPQQQGSAPAPAGQGGQPSLPTSAEGPTATTGDAAEGDDATATTAGGNPLSDAGVTPP